MLEPSRQLSRFLALTLACGCVSGPPEDPLATARSEVHQLMETSGSASALDQWQDLALQVVGEVRDQVSAESFADLEAAIRDSLSVQYLEDEIDRDLAEGYDSRAVADAKRFYDSELGHRIVVAEQALSDPEQREDLKKFAEDLRSHPPRAIRRDLAVRLDVAMRSSADMVELRLQLRRELNREIQTYLSKMDSLTPAASPGPEAADYPLRSAMRAQVVTALLFAHRDLSFKELLRYVDFTESRAGRWFFRKQGEALGSALRAATRSVGRDLEARLAKRNAAAPAAAEAPAPETPEP